MRQMAKCNPTTRLSLLGEAVYSILARTVRCSRRRNNNFFFWVSRRSTTTYTVFAALVRIDDSISLSIIMNPWNRCARKYYVEQLWFASNDENIRSISVARLKQNLQVSVQLIVHRTILAIRRGYAMLLIGLTLSKDKASPWDMQIIT